MQPDILFIFNCILFTFFVHAEERGTCATHWCGGHTTTFWSWRCLSILQVVGLELRLLGLEANILTQWASPLVCIADKFLKMGEDHLDKASLMPGLHIRSLCVFGGLGY